MKVLVVGLGVQGAKRQRHAGADFVAAVDPVNPQAAYRDLADVPLASFDAALVCTPDEPKVGILRYLLGNRKHALVEKPLWAGEEGQLAELEALARSSGVFCYTAYNHRFEPHFVRMRDLVRSGRLGRIYRCRLFYGNGTARLVRESAWRDRGAGVLPDLGSHLLDTAAFWFGTPGEDLRVASASRFENRAPDHVTLLSTASLPQLEFEMTLLMWRNHFTCDLLAENGSAHIESLCKWGPSRFTVRTRVLPSGRPLEESECLAQDDPTWALEYAHFKAACLADRAADFSFDRWLHRTLGRLSAEAIRVAA